MTDSSRHTQHQAYSFACLRCGHLWEQSYAIEQSLDEDGEPCVQYYANGLPIPPPLSHPRCAVCGGHVVRVMRAGRVAATEAARGFGPDGVPGSAAWWP